MILQQFNATKHHKLHIISPHYRFSSHFPCGEIFPHDNLSCGEFFHKTICYVKKFLHMTKRSPTWPQAPLVVPVTNIRYENNDDDVTNENA